MKFTKTSVGGTVEFLAADDFVAILFASQKAAAVPAGMPMTAAGKKVATTSYATAVGMLLYDVDPTENPNGAPSSAGCCRQVKKLSLTQALRWTILCCARYYPAGQHWCERVRRRT